MGFTVGWPGGTSPVSVSDADGYFTDRGIAAWTGADSVKQGALTRATDYVKALFAPRFDPDLFPVVNDLVVVPEELVKAVCEYALVELTAPGTLAPATVNDPTGYAVVLTKKKVGPIEKDFAPVAGSQRLTRRSFPVPDALIASLLLPLTGLSRTMR